MEIRIKISSEISNIFLHNKVVVSFTFWLLWSQHRMMWVDEYVYHPQNHHCSYE